MSCNEVWVIILGSGSSPLCFQLATYRNSKREDRPLPNTRDLGSLHLMHSFARLLQLMGLTIPPLAMFAQLNQSITTGTMLRFLVMAIGLFVLGYTIQRYSGGKS